MAARKRAAWNKDANNTGRLVGEENARAREREREGRKRTDIGEYSCVMHASCVSVDLPNN